MEYPLLDEINKQLQTQQTPLRVWRLAESIYGIGWRYLLPSLLTALTLLESQGKLHVQHGYMGFFKNILTRYSRVQLYKEEL